ncbi:hypothetical protein [Azorhizobium sp. AG788]|uniref:hypothetical protein n=1 Tax=Azorhizobium sp. AG788 TaxID=2183897 RepID=UPI00313905AB
MTALPPVQKPRRRTAEEGALGGLLAVIFWAACGITAVPLAGMFTLISAMGTQGAFSAIADSVSGSALSTQVLRLGLLPQAMLFLWAASFVVFTILKSRHALQVAPGLFMAWVAVTAFCQFSIRSMITPDGATLMDFTALLPGILAQVVGAAAFTAYMRQGHRPRFYFVR